MLTEYQLRKYADKFLKDNYNMELSVPLKLNGRLKTTCGRFVHYRGYNRPKIVEINKYFFENNEPTVVLDVLRHELVHYALYMKEKPFSDGHPVFEKELRKLGIVSQKTIDKYRIASKPIKIRIYECVSCGCEYKRQRALPNGGKNHHCTTCGHEKGKLADRGQKVMAS